MQKLITSVIVMNNQYDALVTPGLQVIAEPIHAYQHLMERHVQAVWLEQKYFKGLKTSDGETIEVLSPGIWNMEAGPDFQRAHLKIGSREYRGDVEIHLVDDSWFQHQHHIDPLYNQVVLHLSLWQPKNAKSITASDGGDILRAYLEPCLTLPPARIVQLIDLDLYPYKRFIGSGKCAHTLFRNLPESKAASFFKGAAEWRLKQKNAYAKMRVEDVKWQMGAGIAMALGYKNNAEAFLDLFLKLQALSLKSEEEFLSLAIGACGFFNAECEKKWEHSALYRHLCALHKTLPSIAAVKLKLNQIRPLNHPLRRLVYMAKLLSDPTIETLHTRMFQHWDDNWPSCQNKKNQRALCMQFHNCIPSYQDPYWNCHYHFEDAISAQFLPLIGEDLKGEILVNSFFPLLHERISHRKDPQEMEIFWNVFASIPASKTGKTRYLIHRFFGDTPKGAVLHKSYTEQGAYQLHRDFCLHFEASCEGCPFVDRYKMQHANNTIAKVLDNMQR